MKILLIVPDYPSKNSVAYKFIHDRVKKYKDEFEVDVFCYNKKFVKEYIFEGIKVIGGSTKKLKELILDNNYSRFVFHFFNIRSAMFIAKHLKNKKVYVWFHGSDCISWKRRLPSINFKIIKIINPIYLFKVIAFIIYNKMRVFNIRKLNKKCLNLTFVFVSKWNKITSEKDLNIKYKKFKIIHNYINFEKFKYSKKNKNQRLKILSINNYANDVYAGDMIQDIILSLSKRKEFKYFNFSIYGDGKLFDLYTSKISKFKNVYINKGFIKTDEIISVHKLNGIFLYPKRGDSQGVSRCEAMASGLVPIASDVEAVSEFSPSNTSYLVNDIEEFVNTLIYIYNNSEDFLKKSKECSKFIFEKCNYNKTIQKEINLIKE